MRPDPRTNRRFGVGVVGLGRIGKVHARNLVETTRSARLVRVMDADESAARSCAEALGVPWSTCWDDLAADPSVEAVVIATPVASHARLIRRAAAAGKHVLCEKPLALDAGEAIDAIEAARDAGVVLQVGFQLRSDPDIADVRDKLVAGNLGAVRFLRASLRDMEPPSVRYLAGSGGLYLDGAVHTLDLARWIVGEIATVTAVDAVAPGSPAAAAGDVDSAVIAVRFADGAVGVLEHSRVAGYGFECRVEVVGSRAAVRVSNHRKTHVQWLTRGAVCVDHTANFLERFRDAYVRELESFALAASGEASIGPSGEDGLAAVVLARAAQRSAATGRTVRVTGRESASSRRVA
jgi:predicted dehydrogenase